MRSLDAKDCAARPVARTLLDAVSPVSYAQDWSVIARNLPSRPYRKVLRLAATLLAIAVAAGVATPRPRLGRERSLRTLAPAGGTRPGQPCAWRPAGDQDPDVTVAAGEALGHADRQMTPVDAAAALPGYRLVASAAAPRLAPEPDAVAAAANARTGPPPGRAPPVSRS